MPEEANKQKSEIESCPIEISPLEGLQKLVTRLDPLQLPPPVTKKALKSKALWGEQCAPGPKVLAPSKMAKKSPASKRAKEFKAPEDEMEASGSENRKVAPSARKRAKKSPGVQNEKCLPGPWVFGELRKVRLTEVRGQKMVDIREYREKNGEILPGRKGISLSVEQWKKLLELGDEITSAAEM